MTLTDIANIVLEDLGAKSIASIDSDDVDAMRVKRRIYTTIEETTSLRKWRCLRKKKRLSVSSKGKFETRFLLPNGLVEIIETCPPCDWRREGNALFAPVSELSIKCTVVSYNPNDWDANFKSAVIAKLGADLAMMITKNPQLAAQKKQLATMEIQRFIANDIFAERPRNVQKEPSWFNGW